jgi:hypothetical protein
MRTQIVKVVTSLSFFALLCASAHAQAAHAPMKAHIPFSFAVGRESMPAGDYVISFVSTQSDLQTIVIKSAGGRTARIVQMTGFEMREAREGGRLVFNRYGSQHFLSQVWEPAERTGLALRRSRAEREVELASGGSAERATVSLTFGR